MYVAFEWADNLTWNSVENNDYAYPVFSNIYYLITELLPMGAQIIWVRIVTNYAKSSSVDGDYQEVKGRYTNLGIVFRLCNWIFRGLGVVIWLDFNVFAYL